MTQTNSLDYWVKINQRLYKEFDDICYHYRIKLQKPLIVLQETPSYLGQWSSSQFTIFLSRPMILQESWQTVVEVLKHEMAHQYLSSYYSHLSTDPHGIEFQQICKRLGMSDWASQASVDIQNKVPPTSPTISTEEDALLRKTQKLLSLAQSSNEHEAALAMQRVQEISAKYNLELKNSNDHHFYSKFIRFRKNKLSSYLYKIGSILMAYFYVEIVFHSEFCVEDLEEKKGMDILGEHHHVVLAEYVYEFLENHLDILFRNFIADHPQKSRQRLSFYMGTLIGFESKLKLQQKEFVQKVAPESYSQFGLVRLDILAPSPLLQDFKHEKFPRLHRVSNSGMRLDHDSYTSGEEAGKKLNLSKPLGADAQKTRLTFLT